MAIEIAGAEALAGISSQMSGMSLDQAYNQFITKQFDTDDGPTIGYADYTSDTPAISGDTSGSISTGTPNATPVDAWHDYVENEQPDVSDTTGGIVSGSSVKTIVYSVMEENPGTATAVAKAVIPVAVPVEAAVVAMAQAAGVSIDAANLDAETKQTLVNSYLATSGVIYDKAKNLVTAWKDEWGRILFPKRAFDSISNALGEMSIGEGKGATSSLTTNWPQPIPFHEGNMSFTTPDDGVCTLEVVGNPKYTFVRIEQARPRLVLAVFGSSASDIVRVTTRWVYQGREYTDTINFIPNISYTNDNKIAYRNGDVYNSNVSGYRTPNVDPDLIFQNQAAVYQPDGPTAWTVLYGEYVEYGYPEGTSGSQADKYNPSTIPVAGNLATSYDPDTGVLGTEPLVPIHLTDDPYNTTGDTTNPTDPTDEDNPGVANPPIPLPIPDTKPSNPDVPLVNPSVIDSTRINELVEELANTLDPQPGQSSGIIPVPPLPGITDPETGQTTFPSIIPDSGPGFIHVYNPTPAEFVAFGTWLWVTYADATIDKILNNPFDGVIGAHELYATPNRGGRDNIRSAFLTCPTTADLVPNRYSEIDCGTVIVPEFYGNYLDYSPYSQAYIYLPFIGINEVSIDDIVGHAVNIRYRVDSYSGSCIAMIFVAKDGYQNLCYQFAGSCSVEVPMAGGSQAAIKAGMMQAEAYARAAMTSAVGHLFGGIGSALMGSLGGALSGIGGIANDYANAKAGVEAARVANKSSVQHSGQFGASHGAMGQKIPFIIIRNPIQVKVVNYNDDYGFPAHKRVIIGGCTGYLRVREVNVISAHATDDEKAAIEALLKNGVYVS